MRARGSIPGGTVWRVDFVGWRFWRSAVLAVLALGGAVHGQAGGQNGLLKSAEDGGFRYFVVKEEGAPLRTEPYLAARVHTVVSQGMLLANLGCITDKNTVLCDIVSLDEKAKGYVPAAHLEAVAGVDDMPLTGPDDSKRRARAKDFDFEGPIKCALNEGDGLGTCQAEVALAGGGDATLIVTFGNGFTRELHFRLGDFIRANATMSGVGTDVEWTAEQGNYRIRVDDQRFDIPTSYILGK